MPFIAAAIVGTGVLGAGAALSGSSKQAKSAGQAAQLSREQFAQTREDLAPYREAGQISLAELQKRMPELTQPFGMQQFQQSPAYQFNLEQGQKAIEKASAKRGTYYAPQTLQDVGKYSQGVASNEFQNAFSNYNTNIDNIFRRLYGVANMGQNASAQTGTFGAQSAGQQGGYITDAGAARAAGGVGAANALSGGAAQLSNRALIQDILAKNQAPTYDWQTPGYGDIGSFEPGIGNIG